MKRIFDIYFDELRCCVTDLGVLVFFVLVPIGYPLLYTYIYSQEVVRDIPIVVCDLSNSRESRNFTQKLDATPDVEVKMRITNFNEAKELMAENKVKGIVYIPHDFSKELNSGEQTNISIYCNMSSLFYYKSMLISCTEVSLAMNKNIQTSLLSDVTAQQAAITTTPMLNKAIDISNSTVGFANFIIPAILVLILQQTLLLGIGMRMGSNRDKGIMLTTPDTIDALAQLTGKCAAYLTFYIPITAYILCIVPAIFDMSQLSHPLVLTAFMLPYLLACIFLAVSAGHFVRERESCMLLFVFTSIPFLFLSGISWPESSIPIFWKILSYALPSTPAINGFVSINETGATLADVANEYRLLWIQVVMYGIAAFITTKSFSKKE